MLVLFDAVQPCFRGGLSARFFFLGKGEGAEAINITTVVISKAVMSKLSRREIKAPDAHAHA